MVHVAKCPLKNRGNPITAFWIKDKPQIYCSGWIDIMTEEVLPECKNCKDYVDGNQCDIDFEEELKRRRKNV